MILDDNDDDDGEEIQEITTSQLFSPNIIKQPFIVSKATT